MKSKPSNCSSPLTVDEVITCFRLRWGVTYDMKLTIKKERIFLQIMWRYLEQQSFPLTEESYRVHLNEILEIVNDLGQAEFVREWIENVGTKPRIGRALTLQLKEGLRLEEFLL